MPLNFPPLPFRAAKEVLTFYRDFSHTIPDELNTACLLTAAPDGVPVVVIAVCYNGAIEAGEQILKPLRTFGQPLADYLRPMPYTEIQSLGGSMALPGRQNY